MPGIRGERKILNVERKVPVSKEAVVPDPGAPPPRGLVRLPSPCAKTGSDTKSFPPHTLLFSADISHLIAPMVAFSVLPYVSKTLAQKRLTAARPLHWTPPLADADAFPNVETRACIYRVADGFMESPRRAVTGTQ